LLLNGLAGKKPGIFCSGAASLAESQYVCTRQKGIDHESRPLPAGRRQLDRGIGCENSKTESRSYIKRKGPEKPGPF